MIFVLLRNPVNLTSGLQVDMKPASDVIAGAVARAASQGTIHPLDTLKVQLQSNKGRAPKLSKIAQLVPPQGTTSTFPFSILIIPLLAIVFTDGLPVCLLAPSSRSVIHS